MKPVALPCVVLLLSAAAPAAAQSEWLAAEGTSVALEYRHPSFGDMNPDLEPSPLNGAFFLSGRYALPASGIALVGEIPYGYFDFDDIEGGGGLLGNVYLGAEAPILLGAATVEAGARLPTAGQVDPDHAAVLAFAATFPDRYDAFGGMYFLQRVFVPRLGIEAGIPGVPVVDAKANAGIAYIMREDTDDIDVPSFDSDLMLDLGVRAFANLVGARVGAGIEGAIELTGEGEDDFAGGEAESFGERSMFSAGLWLDYAFGMLRPGISFFVPLNENSSFVYPQDQSESTQADWVLGLSLEVALPI